MSPWIGWWWSSSQQVGCATTDAFGAFEITFRWCCGWWPWWWWRQRYWQLEPQLADRIGLELQRDPTLPRLAVPSPEPSLTVFEPLLAEGGVPTGRLRGAVDPAGLDALRRDLVARLPAAPDLGELRLWPWHPWHPWWDCWPARCRRSRRHASTPSKPCARNDAAASGLRRLRQVMGDAPGVVSAAP